MQSPIQYLKTSVSCVAFALPTLFAALALSGAPVFAESKFSFSWGKSIQGSGKVVEVQRSLPPFDQVAVSDGIQVVFHRSAQQKVVVKAEDNIEPLIETRVEGSALRIRVRPQSSFRTSNSIVVNIDYTLLNSLKVVDGAQADLDAVTGTRFQASVHDGAQLRMTAVTVNEFDLSVKDGSRASLGKVTSSGAQRYRVSDGARLGIDNASGERITISVADGSQMTLRTVDTKAIEVSVADGAKADISGVAHQQSYALSDAASVDALKLQGTAARVRASDGSTLKLGLVQTLDADVQDGSSVRYSGEPTINKRLRDGASVRKI